jgi:hypothetical protein
VRSWLEWNNPPANVAADEVESIANANSLAFIYEIPFRVEAAVLRIEAAVNPFSASGEPIAPGREKNLACAKMEENVASRP